MALGTTIVIIILFLVFIALGVNAYYITVFYDKVKKSTLCTSDPTIGNNANSSGLKNGRNALISVYVSASILLIAAIILIVIKVQSGGVI
jgi:hypothetical protein